MLNLNERKLLQSLSNIALNAYYKQRNHKGKTLRVKAKDGSKPYSNPVSFFLGYFGCSLLAGLLHTET